MILFCDEDLGTGVPKALRFVDLKVFDVISRYKPERKGNKSVPDTYWLKEAGAKGWLVLSCNKEMLNVQEERETIEQERVGIVFLTTGQERSPDVLRLILNKWSWLEAVDSQIPRPFVFTITIMGRIARLPIAPLSRRRRRNRAI